MNSERFDHVCGIVNHKEILVAGGTDSSDHILDSVEILSFVSLEWRYDTPLPERISGAIGLPFGSSLLVIGGYENEQNASNIYQYLENRHDWAKRKETLAIKRSKHIAITIEGMKFKIQ